MAHVKIMHKGFAPVTIELTLKTEDELNAFKNVNNIGYLEPVVQKMLRLIEQLLKD